jgi:glutathione S-transferase
MKLVVHQLDFSPYCIPITAALDALGVAYRTDEVSYGDRTKIIRLTRGRYYQVPVLEHGGKVIFETGPDTIDVARYVDRTWAGGRLFPSETEGLQRILVSHIENEIEGTTFKLMDPHRIDAIKDFATRVEHIRYKERRFGRGCLEQWKREAPALRRRAEALLEPFDLMVRHTPFLLGDAPVYADYALFGIAGNLTYGGYAKLPARLVALARWQRRLKAWRFA